MRHLKRQIFTLAAALTLAACGGNNTTKNNDTTNATPNGTPNAMPNNLDNNDPCGGVACAAPAANCVGQIAVTYSGAGMCVEATATCDYTNVETRTDCTTTGQNCVDGACVDIDDLCAGVMCPAPAAPACEGTEVVSSAAGVCNPASGMCDYTESRVDCATTSQICVAGACSDPTPAPNPGELVVTEIMPNPASVGDGEGEWFEIFNASARDLDLNGLTITDDGGDSFAIPAATAMLASGAYLVFGINAEMATNGGLAVDIEYSGINLANSADELVIVDANAVEIDRVAWDDSAGWIIGSGSSIGFGAQYDAAADDNNDAQFWCSALSTYGDGDFGTPGAANDMCPAPVTVTLYQIANDADPDHPVVNSLVDVVGVSITALDVGAGFVWLQETAGGEYSGVYVDAGGVDVSALAVGDIVDISGTYDEWNGELARITASAITDSGNDLLIAPRVVESSLLADAATAEPWENVLIQINEAGVTDIDAGAAFGEVLVDSNIVVDDLLFDGFTSATECQVYATIVGPLNYSFGAFKIEPRDANDIGAAISATAATAVTQAGLAFTPAAICITAGDTVTWTNNDALSHTVTQRLASQPAGLNANLPAIPLFDEVLAGNGTATVTFAEAGTFPYRCRPHATMEGIVVVPDP